MNCELAQKRIIDDLTHQRDEEIKAHLESCLECQHLCDDLLALEELARSLGDQYRVPTGFGERLLAQKPKRGFGGFFGLRPILVPLAVVMLSFGFFWLNDDGAARQDELLVVEEVAAVDAAEFEDAGSAYIEVVVEDPVEGQMMIHLPSAIEIHRTELHEDFHYQNTGY